MPVFITWANAGMAAAVTAFLYVFSDKFDDTADAATKMLTAFSWAIALLILMQSGLIQRAVKGL